MLLITVHDNVNDGNKSPEKTLIGKSSKFKKGFSLESYRKEEMPPIPQLTLPMQAAAERMKRGYLQRDSSPREWGPGRGTQEK